jgi:hypothetical protein
MWVALALIPILVALALVGHRHDRGHHGDGPNRSIPGLAPSASAPHGAESGLPSMDLFGNRLDAVANDAGVALAQDAGKRPDAHLPDYLSTGPSEMEWQRG